MPSKQAVPIKLSIDGVKKFADRVGREYEIYDADGHADLYKLVAELGGRVEVRDGVESLHVNADDTFVIYVPTYTPPRRDRFTIGHELGHYFLHYLNAEGDDPVRRFERHGSSRAETQANHFAAALIMPAAEFTSAVERHRRDAARVARQFDVSPQAARVRGAVLGLDVA